MATLVDPSDDQGERDISNQLNPTVTALGNKTGSVTITHSYANDVQTLTATGNLTITMAAGSTTASGDRITLIITQDGTGSRTFTAGSNVKLAGGAVTLTTTATTGKDLLEFVLVGTTWYEVSRSLALA